MSAELYRGTVRRIAPEGVYIELTELGVGMEFGPLFSPYTHAVGDRVIAGQVTGVLEDIVIVAPLTSVANIGGPGGTVNWSSIEDKPTFSYIHYQDTPNVQWTVVHNMNTYPNVTIVDSGGTVVEGADITYVDSNTLTAEFGAAFGGRAYLS